MKMPKLTFSLIVFCLVAWVAPIPSFAAEASVDGWLSIVWGDAREPGAISHQRISLTDDHGKTTELTMSPELLKGGVFRWNGRKVRVFIDAKAFAEAPDGPLPVAALSLIGEKSALAAVAGSQPWISILCKFAGLDDEPRDLGFFQGMYGNFPGGLDHYWREVSGDEIDIVGSTAIDWVELPGNHTSYVPTPGSGTTADLNAIFNDCTAAVDSIVDFANGGSPYVGINIMLNANLDCCAWGGSRFATLDGVTKSWRTTWEPPWGYANEGVMAHEMGHGFGLPHANNWDQDSSPYDSPWDVMSSATGHAVSDITYGALGKHVNAYHKDSLGWIAPERRFEALANSSTSILLDHTAIPLPINYLMARVPIDATRWYTVEARLRTGAYELNLPGDAVIIHEVDTTRTEPSWAVDDAEPPADYSSNPGTMWTVGETFVDDVNQISISIDAFTGIGFGITVTVDDPSLLFQDGFETGGFDLWAVVSP